MLKVSRAGYYKWLNRVPSESEKRLRRLMELIHEVYESVQGIYGYRRITIYLNYYRNSKMYSASYETNGIKGNYTKKTLSL